MIRPLRSSCSVASASSSLRLTIGTGVTLPAVHEVHHLLHLGRAAGHRAHDLAAGEGEHRQRRREGAAEQADDDQPAAARRARARRTAPRPRRRRSRCAAPTPVPPVSSMICLRASLSRGSSAAQAPFSSASLRLFSSMSATIGSRPSTDLAKRTPIRPTPPAPITRIGLPPSWPTAFLTAPKAVMPEQA